jgi:hypothetical protein
MVAACAATMKRMPTKNLEMNMAMLVVVVCGGVWWWCFDWVVDVLERNPSSILYLLSHFLRAREATAYCILPGLPFVSLLSSPLSLDAQSQFTPYPHTLRHFNSHLAGNPISSHPFHFPRALVDVRASIHLALPLAASGWQNASAGGNGYDGHPLFSVSGSVEGLADGWRRFWLPANDNIHFRSVFIVRVKWGPEPPVWPIFFRNRLSKVVEKHDS